jgi:hypothetical protein
MTPEVELALTQFLCDGATNAEACRLANISEDSFYRKYKSDQGFADKMDTAKNETIFKAKKVLKRAIDSGDKQVAGWYLERKAKVEFAPRQELTGPEGIPLGYTYSSDPRLKENNHAIQVDKTTEVPLLTETDSSEEVGKKVRIEDTKEAQ